MKLASQTELNVARQLIKDDMNEEGLNEYRKLYQKYPNDQNLLCEFGSLLLRQGINISEALYMLKLAVNYSNQHVISYEIGKHFLDKSDFDEAEKYFSSMLKGNETNKCYALRTLVVIDIHRGDYNEAYKKFRKLEWISKTCSFIIPHYYNLKFLIFYNNNMNLNQFYMQDYFVSQVMNYSEDDAVEHIKKHLDSSDYKNVHSMFNEEVDVNKLYYQISDKIKNMKPSSIDIVDFYTIELNNNIGETYRNVETSCIEVITIPNTKKIVSMYPISTDHINKITKLKEEKDIPQKNKKSKKRKKLTKKSK